MSDGRITRGGFLARAGLAGAVALGGGFALGRATAEDGGTKDVVPFEGPHQAGITTPAQLHVVLAAYDLEPRSRATLTALLRDWTAAARRLTRGLELEGGPSGYLAPPADTGEAGGLSPARLTLTFGLGPGAFGPGTGLAAARPPALADLPRFDGEALDPARSGGDLVVQACADDPQVAFHAVRNLARIARGAAAMRWMQRGFLTPSRDADSATPRNLMGFRDGTNNLDVADPAVTRAQLWAAPGDGAPWMAGGTYLVVRRIRIRTEAWDRTGLAEQEQLIGRHKATGAPLGADREHDPVALGRMDPVAHVRVASADGPRRAGERLLRRGYNFADGIDPATGQLDAGLLFMAYQRDPRTQFVPLQARLAAQDGLNEYLLHTASAVFAVPPGVGAGGYVGQTLLT